MTKLDGQILGNNIREGIIRFDDASPLLGRVTGLTNVGRGRSKNQDALSVHMLPDRLVLCVADGLGCYENSEKSAYHAVTSVPQDLAEGIDFVNSCGDVHHELLNYYPYLQKGYPKLPSQKEDMGATTLVSAEILGNRLTIANIGDSRAYLIRDNKIIFSTRDQSILGLMFLTGEVKKTDNWRKNPYRSVLLNALGSPEKEFDYIVNDKMVPNPTGFPLLETMEIKKDDYLLLASDGFYMNLTETEIANECPRHHHNPEWFTDKILQVIKNGKTTEGIEATHDNFTFLVYKHL
ncbi:serine/threonine-protein phosphatase [bacterium]|nr:serine/threonine-protein phosphatase [bacterium]